MFPSAARRSLASLIPPKIATPNAVVSRLSGSRLPSLKVEDHLLIPSQSSGSTSARTAAVIDFYSKLPKGPKPDSERPGGLRGRYFEGKNASG